MSVQNRRARRRPLALLAAACVAAAILWVVAGQAHALAATVPGHTNANGPPAKSAGSACPVAVGLICGSYGTLQYELYVPQGYTNGTAMPLVVALHGCTETADSYRQLSGWDTFAQAQANLGKGFIVLFPQQSSSRNSLDCWNWFQTANNQRGSGEPSIIAGMVTSVVEPTYTIDHQNVFVAGFSAGGAMANVMGATYPDIFAAVGSGSGCEYDGSPCGKATGPAAATTGLAADRAMDGFGHVIPAIVFQGDADKVVVPANAPLIVQQWQVTDNYVLGFGPTGPIPTTPSPQCLSSSPATCQSSNMTSSGGQSYTVTNWPDENGHQLIQYDLVYGMGHAWSGGPSNLQYSDPSGPGETQMMYAFFATHPCTALSSASPAGGWCAP